MSNAGAFQAATGTVRFTTIENSPAELSIVDCQSIKGIIENKAPLRRSFNARKDKPAPEMDQATADNCCEILYAANMSVTVKGTIHDVLKTLEQAGFVNFDLRKRKREGLHIALKNGLASPSEETAILQTPEGPYEARFHARDQNENAAIANNNNGADLNPLGAVA